MGEALAYPTIKLLCEGYSDVEAAPLLVRRLRNDLFRDGSPERSVAIHNSALRVGNYVNLLTAKDGRTELEKKLVLATQKGPERERASGIILLIDGDVLPKIGRNKAAKEPPPIDCPVFAASNLVEIASRAGAGKTFSLAVVFAMQEVETWMIAGASSIQQNDKSYVYRLRKKTEFPTGNLEEAPRNAKGWLKYNFENGYTETTDLAKLVKLVDIAQIRGKKLRSFQRIENAVAQICAAVVTGVHIATPQPGAAC